MTLERLLALVPEVYADLQTAAVPTRSAEPPDSSPDPRNRPAPARLEVVEHRHKLLRGLRWWTDAVVDLDTGTRVGNSPARMCALLLHHLPDMAAEDRAELHGNLSEWVADAWPMTGDVQPPTVPALPLEALDRRVPVHVAAQALGVSVSTVKRRTPGRTRGEVLLREAAGPLCDRSGLPPAWCGEAQCTRTGCAVGA